MKATAAFAGAILCVLCSTSEGKEDSASANYAMVGCRHYVSGRQDDEFPVRQGVCHGAVSAVLDFASGICHPPGATLDQGIRIVVQYIDSHPARLHESFNALAAEALRDAWPCKAH
jgi:hypothetical protein